MRRLLMIFVLAGMVLSVAAQQNEKDPFYTILLGNSIEWKTGKVEIKPIAKVGSSNCVEITHQGSIATVKGVKRGLVMLKATLADGTIKKCKIRVTTAATTTSGQEKWDGVYELKIPIDNWHIAYKNLKTGKVSRAARIGDIFATVFDFTDEQTICERFDKSIKQGYQAFSNDPEFRHYDDAGGDTVESFVGYFREFGPKDFDRAFISGSGDICSQRDDDDVCLLTCQRQIVE